MQRARILHAMAEIVATQLASYKALKERWHEWSTVKAVLADLAERMAR